MDGLIFMAETRWTFSGVLGELPDFVILEFGVWSLVYVRVSQ